MATSPDARISSNIDDALRFLQRQADGHLEIQVTETDESHLRRLVERYLARDR